MLPGTLTTIATSSIVASVVTVGLTAYREGRRRRVTARLSALDAINAVEDYVGACMTLLEELDADDYELSVINDEGPIQSRFKLVPDFPPFSERIDWGAMGVETSVAIRNYRTAALSSRTAATLQWSPYLPDAFAKVKQYTARLALDGIELGSFLRRKWKLAGANSELPTNIGDGLRSRHNSYVDERKAIHSRTSLDAE